MVVECKNCGGPAIPLFTGFACKNECDLKKEATGEWLYYLAPEKHALRGRSLFRTPEELTRCKTTLLLFAYRGPVEPSPGFAKSSTRAVGVTTDEGESRRVLYSGKAFNFPGLQPGYRRRVAFGSGNTELEWTGHAWIRISP